MKQWIIVFLLLLTGIGFVSWTNNKNKELVSPGGEVVKVKPYDKYTFNNLAKREFKPGKIEIGRVIETQTDFTSYMFYYQSEGRRISGQLNLPAQAGLPNLSRQMKVIVMARGYVEKEEYKTGIGTKNAATVFAKNGYITLAPDFSGYGESDSEDTSALGARLTKPVEIIDLIASLASLPQADVNNVYLWGHSNGGQIMLSVAEIVGMRNGIEGVNIKGLTLWAPVSKPFPYNILYYTNDPPTPKASDGQELGDQGKQLRKILAEFEKDYDVFNYSIDRYYEAINLPIQLHQGTADEAVPFKWSDELVKTLKEKGKTVEYYKYPGVDHNMKPEWNKVIERDLSFFNQ